MTKVIETIDIRAPQDFVFAAITDPRRTMDWNSNIVELGRLSENPPRPGTTWSQTAVMAGRPAKLNCRISAWNPPEIGVLDISGDQTAKVTIRCTSAGSATCVEQTIDFKPPGGLIGAVAGNLIAQQVRRELRKTLQRQRDVLEAENRGTNGPRSS
jgi:uncharacterized membrane protein